MKKEILALVMAGVMTCSLCACGNSTSTAEATAEPTAAAETAAPATEAPEETTAPQETTGLANPVVEYNSLEEINELTGARFSHPAVMGVTDESFSVINGEPVVAQYNFSVNGVPYTFRFSADFTTDISGIYADNGTLFTGNAGETEYKEFDGGKAARTANVDGQYTLVAEDASMDMDTFKGIAEELFAQVTPSETTDAEMFAGKWAEKLSGRGQIEVTVSGNTATFSVRWPNSAAEVYFTTFSGDANGNVVSYTNGIQVSAVYDEKGNETDTTLYENGTGTVTFNNDDGTITWIENGVNDEGSVFVRAD